MITRHKTGMNSEIVARKRYLYYNSYKMHKERMNRCKDMKSKTEKYFGCYMIILCERFCLYCRPLDNFVHRFDLEISPPVSLLIYCDGFFI